MPLYEYRCAACGCQFERLVSPGRSEQDQEQVTCVQCGTAEVSKLISVGSFKMGSGSSASSRPFASGNCSSPGGFS